LALFCHFPESGKRRRCAERRLPPNWLRSTSFRYFGSAAGGRATTGPGRRQAELALFCHFRESGNGDGARTAGCGQIGFVPFVPLFRECGRRTSGERTRSAPGGIGFVLSFAGTTAGAVNSG
jgi:hypothetical protein